MELNKQPYSGISGVTGIPASWKRELWEWLLAVAAISLALWFSRTIGRIISSSAMALLWLVR